MQNRPKYYQSSKRQKYVSRAAYKLALACAELKLDFKTKVVLDVGSSSGGFSQYALIHGAQKIIAIEKGTNQMDQLLRLDPRIELHEKTDILNYTPAEHIDLILIDVSFISLKEVLPAIKQCLDQDTIILAMAKPQFETNDPKAKNKGIIKNEHIRRHLLSLLELWLKEQFVIIDKVDSQLKGVKGNKERFYLLKGLK